MKQSYFIVTIGYTPAPAIGEPSPTEPDGTARIFVNTQGPDDEPDEQVQAKAEADVRAAFGKSKPDQHIVELRMNKVDAATYETQRIMNLSKGTKKL